MCKAQDDGIKFTLRVKIWFFTHRGDSLHQFMWNLAWSTGTWIWLAVQNFTSMGAGGGNAAPKYQKFPLFGRVASHGQTPWPISKIFTGFYTPNYLTLVFQIWHDSLHRLWSYCWETMRQPFRPNFFMHPVGKNCALDRKIIGTFFSGLDVLNHHAKFGGDWTMRAGCRCENVVFVCFCLSHFESGGPFSQGGYILNSYCVAVYESILILFSPHFQKWLPFQMR